ncbi:MAG: hypothetical protein WDM88_07385 [Galbitalea sp.]
MSALDFGPLVPRRQHLRVDLDRDESFAVLDAFVAAGGRSIDTAGLLQPVGSRQLGR